MLTKMKCIKIAAETTKGTQVAGTQDVAVYDLDIHPTGPHIERKGSGIYLGQTEPGIIGEQIGVCSFKTEVRGNGTSGLDTALAILLQAVGFKKATEVYSLCSTVTDMKTISIDVYEDGLKKSLYGAAGTVTFEGEIGKRLMANFEFSGSWVAVTDVALPAYAPSTTTPPILKGGTFTVGAAERQISKLSLPVQAVVTPRMDVNAASGVLHYQVTDYDPLFTFDPEAVLVATYDDLGIWLAGTEAAVSLILSATATLTFAIPKLQYREIPEGDREGLLIHDITGQCRHDSGDDAVSITVT